MVDIVEIMWKPILRKNVIASSRNCFSGYWKTVFSIYHIFQAVKIVSLNGSVFFNEFFIWASENEFSV